MTNSESAPLTAEEIDMSDVTVEVLAENAESNHLFDTATLLRALRSELTAAQARAERATEEAIRECAGKARDARSGISGHVCTYDAGKRTASRSIESTILALLAPGAARHGE